MIFSLFLLSIFFLPLAVYFCCPIQYHPFPSYCIYHFILEGFHFCRHSLPPFFPNIPPLLFPSLPCVWFSFYCILNIWGRAVPGSRSSVNKHSSGAVVFLSFLYCFSFYRQHLAMQKKKKVAGSLQWNSFNKALWRFCENCCVRLPSASLSHFYSSADYFLISSSRLNPTTWASVHHRL